MCAFWKYLCSLFFLLTFAVGFFFVWHAVRLFFSFDGKKMAQKSVCVFKASPLHDPMTPDPLDKRLHSHCSLSTRLTVRVKKNFLGSKNVVCVKCFSLSL